MALTFVAPYLHGAFTENGSGISGRILKNSFVRTLR
jgi:hypothetical protein